MRPVSTHAIKSDTKEDHTTALFDKLFPVSGKEKGPEWPFATIIYK
jgi:hypothetical protein